MKNVTAAKTTLPLTDAIQQKDCADPSQCRPGIVNRSCKHCRLRYIRNGIAYYKSNLAGAINRQYRLQLMAEFGKDWIDGHKVIKGIKQQCDQRQREKQSGTRSARQKA